MINSICWVYVLKRWFLEENYKGQRKKIFICVLMFSKLAYWTQNNFCLICLCGIIYLFHYQSGMNWKTGVSLESTGKKGQSRLFCSTTTSEMVLEWFERFSNFLCSLVQMTKVSSLSEELKDKEILNADFTMCIWDSYQNENQKSKTFAKKIKCSWSNLTLKNKCFILWDLWWKSVGLQK